MSARWKERLRIARTVAPAVLIAFLIDVWLARTSLAEGLGLLSVYAVLFVIFFAVGRWIGKRSWPKRGQALARAMLKRRLRRKRDFVFVSDRPDRTFTTLRRVWEVVGFSAGVSVLVSTLLGLLNLTPSSLIFAAVVLPLLLPMVVTWFAFVLIPYWIFARLGFRVVDPVRWLVLPLSSRYADRLKLSNGALVLLALGAVFNLTWRAGVSGPEAVAQALTLVLRVVAVVLVIAATAVAYYLHEERRISHELELESIGFGIRDGRGMSDGDFLPRLPPPRKA